MNSVKYKLINGRAILILNDELIYPNYNKINDKLVLFNDEICILRENSYYYEFLRLKEIENKIKENNTNWNSEIVKIKWYNYYDNIIKLVKSYKRDFLIRELFNTLTIDHYSLAC